MSFIPLYTVEDITTCMAKQGMKYGMECPSYHRELQRPEREREREREGER